MNKEFEKIIEKLEERTSFLSDCTKYGNKDAEQQKNSYSTMMMYEVADLVDGLIDIVKQEAEQYNGGWIPCSERLPENDKKKYIVQKTNGFIDILGFTKDAYKLSRYDFTEHKGKKKQLFYDYDSEYGYTEWECEAWQPLPQPYQQKGEIDE